ncbi:MAG: hypothetical protein AB1521_00530 [Bacteroidota bacterium]
MLNNYIRSLAAKRHIAGPDLKSAGGICRWSSTNGYATTISVWTHYGDNKHEVAQEYMKIVDAISQNGFESYLSIKPSAIKFDLNLFEQIIKEIPGSKIRIHFDSFIPEYAERSFRFFKQAKAIYDNLGYTLPARWQRSFYDAYELAGMKVPVRIVKGQWTDPGDEIISVEENFLKIVHMLIDHVPLIALATHDEHLAEKAIRIFDNTKTDFELEQFFSLPSIGDAVQAKFDSKKIKVRFYVAYGEPYLQYNLRTAYERPAMIGWFVSDLFNRRQRINIKFSNKMMERL